MYVSSDPEGERYARDFEEVLSDARWHITGPGATGFSDLPLPVGVIIQVPEADRDNPTAAVLMRALRAQGIDAEIQVFVVSRPVMLVGFKP